jgi:hypothetical protein
LSVDVHRRDGVGAHRTDQGVGVQVRRIYTTPLKFIGSGSDDPTEQVVSEGTSGGPEGAKAGTYLLPKTHLLDVLSGTLKMGFWFLFRRLFLTAPLRGRGLVLVVSN